MSSWSSWFQGTDVPSIDTLKNPIDEEKDAESLAVLLLLVAIVVSSVALFMWGWPKLKAVCVYAIKWIIMMLVWELLKRALFYRITANTWMRALFRWRHSFFHMWESVRGFF
jgi:small-conductance mechanosensitive channel